MTPEELITERLKELHCGERNAVTSHALESAFRIRGPELRNIINTLRSRGIPICSSAKGYFYAETEEELYRTIQQFQSRIGKMFRAKRGLIKASRERFPNRNQIFLSFEGGDSG